MIYLGWSDLMLKVNIDLKIKCCNPKLDYSVFIIYYLKGNEIFDNAFSALS
ncbi:MAG: hypothetical protein K0Q97_778 [Bacillota bacterium]|nr:hypothetical protein [Bacillota bacterium]